MLIEDKNCNNFEIAVLINYKTGCLEFKCYLNSLFCQHVETQSSSVTVSLFASSVSQR